MNNKPTYLSKEGLDKLRTELDEMTSVKRPEVAQRIHDAKEHGDLSENAEYEDAKNEQAFVEGRISNESPVGRALLGKKKGEKVLVKVPAGDFTYKFVGIT
jgi:transcription elongation GreA/GreB family factor